jgi:DNA-binding HxlR family transcriptional regulator
VRSYDQHCGLARALDVVGDRWTLLIVRELFIRQPCRYTDLQYGLPGIATNLLADRLRQLEETGIVRREVAPPPVATTVFSLTERGEDLRPVLSALGRWGAPLLDDTPADAWFRSHWLVFPLTEALQDREPLDPPATIALQVGDDPLVVEVADGKVAVHPGSIAEPDVIVTGSPMTTIRLLLGRIDLAAARKQGLEIAGDASALRRVLPARS